MDDTERKPKSPHAPATALPAAVLERMNEGVTLSDPSGIIVFANPAEERMFGYGPGELLGKHVTVKAARRDVDGEAFLAGVMAYVTEHGEWIGEFHNRRKDGSTFTTRARVTSLALEGVPHLLCVQADIGEELLAQSRADTLAHRLATSEQKLRLVTDALPALVTYIDQERRYAFVNEAYRTWFGVDPQKLVGKRVSDLIPDYENFRPYIDAALAGETVRYESELTVRDGRKVFIAAQYIPDKDEQGKTRGYVALAHDITEQVEARRDVEQLAQALRESEARYRGFVQQSTEGIWRIEMDQPVDTDAPVEAQLAHFYAHAYLAECNDAMARMYGYERAEELFGARLGDLLVEADARNQAYLRAFVESGYRLELAESQETDRYGQRRVFRNSLVGTVVDGFLVRAWGTQSDVTAEVEARDKAFALSRAKDEFLAMLGHELRNPLAPILSALEVMKQKDGPAFVRERGIIERQLKHVVRLVDDLLDVSRITRGTVSLALGEERVSELVADAVEAVGPAIAQRNQQLVVRVPEGLLLTADATRMRQVLLNLLSNASKYTPDGGHISLVASATEDEVRIDVEDTGMGIHPDILPRVFELFVQEKQELDRARGGLGLGLAIVRAIVTQHGGRVEARSEGPGRGSLFSVYLPRLHGAAAPKPAQGQSLSPPARAGMRVMVVDDNEDGAEMLAAVLEGWGHTVRIAHDGPSALTLAEEFAPDLALLDIGLPVMDGYELARRLLSQPSTSRARLVAVTGYGQAKDRRAAMDAGFAGHLVKPVDLKLLQRTLTDLLDHSS